MFDFIELVRTLGSPALATEASACDAFVAARWPSGPVPCPTCGCPCRRNLAKLRCTGPRPHSSTILAGTPLGTKLKPSVRALLLAARAMSCTTRSISAAELAEEVGMNRVTLWRHMHSLRAVLASGSASPIATIAKQTIRTWINGTFHGISDAWRHRYEQEIRARWQLCGFLLDDTIAAFIVGAPAITLRAARSRSRRPLPSRARRRAASAPGVGLRGRDVAEQRAPFPMHVRA